MGSEFSVGGDPRARCSLCGNFKPNCKEVSEETSILFLCANCQEKLELDISELKRRYERGERQDLWGDVKNKLGH